MWFLSLLLYIILTIILIGFSLANAGQTVSELVLWEWGDRLVLEQVSLVHVVLIAFFAGVGLLLLAQLGRELSLRRRLRLEERRRLQLDQELAAIRHLPFEEPLPRVVRQDAND